MQENQKLKDWKFYLEAYIFTYAAKNVKTSICLFIESSFDFPHRINKGFKRKRLCTE